MAWENRFRLSIGQPYNIGREQKQNSPQWQDLLLSPQRIKRPHLLQSSSYTPIKKTDSRTHWLHRLQIPIRPEPQQHQNHRNEHIRLIYQQRRPLKNVLPLFHHRLHRMEPQTLIPWMQINRCLWQVRRYLSLNNSSPQNQWSLRHITRWWQSSQSPRTLHQQNELQRIILNSWRRIGKKIRFKKRKNFYHRPSPCKRFRWCSLNFTWWRQLSTRSSHRRCKLLLSRRIICRLISKKKNNFSISSSSSSSHASQSPLLKFLFFKSWCQ